MRTARDWPRTVAAALLAFAEAAETADRLDWTLYGWREVARRSPEDAPSRVRLAQLYRRLGWQQDAARQLEIATAVSPDSLAVMREAASFYAVAGPTPSARS